MVRWTVKRRWFAYTVSLLGLGMGLQIIVSYAFQCWGAMFGAKAWLDAATAAGVDAELRASLSQLTVAAERVKSSPAVGDDTGVDLEHAITVELEQAKPLRVFWALVDGDGKVGRTSDDACTAAVHRHVREGQWSGRPLIGCDGAAALTTVHSVPGNRWRGLVLGWMLDDAYARRFSVVANTEVAFFVDGVSRGSSLLAADGGAVSLDVAPSALDEAFRTGAFAFRSDGHAPASYRGYGPSNKELLPVRRRDAWYYGARRLSSEENVVLVAAVPVEWMVLGAKYSATATAVFSIVLLVMMGALVRHLVGRFSGPLEALTRSAKGVARGDLSREVAEPRDLEMREFCNTYNDMLRSMRELLELRQKLAREAGMADIANGVLHNIGNVLNSVNVSMSIARDSVKGSRIAGIGKLSKLLDEHASDLGSFVTNDARGQKVPDYLRSLSAELERERETFARELDNVSKSVEHVKRIVGAQQRYATTSGLAERCVLGEVVRDAARMSCGTLANHGIDLSFELSSTELVVDRHKLLQILINLLTNAKQALVERDASTEPATFVKRIVVKSEVVDGDRVRLTVEDNGIGIGPEHRSRVFGQGFTTKPHGHGIGLHNCALAARDMGGGLSFESGGTGRGASFTLDLPIEAPSSPTLPASSRFSSTTVIAA
jgi:signal transduction histidine kinase